jgi:uncharacterized cupredoxin-like copper-binding protein
MSVTSGGRRPCRRRRALISLVPLLAVIALLGAGCSNGESLTKYEVSVQKFRFSGMPTSVDSGKEFNVEFSNRESLAITHEMVVVQLPSGKSSKDVIADAKKGGVDSEDDWLHFGEIAEVNTGATKVGTFVLPPGTYALACWQTGNLGGGEGDAHAARGMVFQFTVKS